MMMKYFLPLSEIVLDFHDKLKALTSGYASFDYEPQGYYSTNIVKLNVHLNGNVVDELSRIVHATKVNSFARDLVFRLKEMIPRQMIQIAVQACVGSKVLARETIKAYRKDVTAKLVNQSVFTMRSNEIPVCLTTFNSFFFSIISVWRRCNQTNEAAKTTIRWKEENAFHSQCSCPTRNFHCRFAEVVNSKHKDAVSL